MVLLRAFFNPFSGAAMNAVLPQGGHTYVHYRADWQLESVKIGELAMRKLFRQMQPMGARDERALAAFRAKRTRRNFKA